MRDFARAVGAIVRNRAGRPVEIRRKTPLFVGDEAVGEAVHQGQVRRQELAVSDP